MTRGPGNNPTVVVSAVVVSDDAFSATLVCRERPTPPQYPATLWALGRPPQHIAELHRLMRASDDGLVLTYRTRPAVALDCAEAPKVGDEGALIQWWTARVLELVTDPNPPLERIPSSALRCDSCEMCYKTLPDGPWAWKRASNEICDGCHRDFVRSDRLRLRGPS